MKVDLVGVVESAYRIEDGAAAWLRGVTEAVAPVLDMGGGVTGLLVDGRGSVPAPPKVVALAGANHVPDAVMQLHVRMSELSATEDARHRFVSAGAVGTLSRTAGLAAYEGGIRALLEMVGSRDVVYVLACPLDDLVCVLSANTTKPPRLHRAKIHVLERLAAHVAAGCRLLSAGVIREPEAVIDPSGKILHAEGAALEPSSHAALRRAALASERGRGPLRRRDPVEAVAAWRALVAGRWSLVDHFDTDGRRYLIARENERNDVARWSLTSRELQVVQLVAQGHSDKLIAYELGLNIGSVATHVSRARGKLGVATRVELIRVFLSGPRDVS